MTAEPVDVQLPKNVGTAYVVECELGRGGMATVYLARDTKHDRRVAVKVLHPALMGAVAVERFLREIRIAATLQHRHILGLIDSGVLGNEWGDSAGRGNRVVVWLHALDALAESGAPGQQRW